MLDNDGFSPMHWAAFNGFESCLDVLMHTEASPGTSLTSKETPYSVEMGLKRANLITQYFTQGTTTPLHCAACQENVSCSQMLIEKFGTDILLLKDAKGR